MALIGIDVVACLWTENEQLLTILPSLSLPALPRSVNCQPKAALGICSLPSTWQRHRGLPAPAKRDQHDQYKKIPTSAMTTFDALNVVEQDSDGAGKRRRSPSSLRELQGKVEPVLGA